MLVSWGGIFCLVPGVEPRISCVIGNCFTLELRLQPLRINFNVNQKWRKQKTQGIKAVYFVLYVYRGMGRAESIGSGTSHIGTLPPCRSSHVWNCTHSAAHASPFLPVYSASSPPDYFCSVHFTSTISMYSQSTSLLCT